MKFVMLHSVPSAFFDGPMPTEVRTELNAWHEEMEARGVHLDGARLAPEAGATSVRRTPESTLVNDGPFAETKEQVAGYNVIECDDLDSALAVASAHPTTRFGSIEVRAFDPGMPDPDVPETVADGKRRYLMLVCADMHRAMAAETGAADAAADITDTTETTDTAEDDGSTAIDAWLESVSDRRIYGWPLDFPNRAKIVRRVNGQIVTTDGPFAETKEQIAGFDLLECSDLDEAIAAAASHPMAERGVLDLRLVLV